jgi:hypothetical protein
MTRRSETCHRSDSPRRSAPARLAALAWLLALSTAFIGCGSSENKVIMPENPMPLPGPDALNDPSLGSQSQAPPPGQTPQAPQ